ncbi:hypothetical protein L6164_005762 [Bauhinia variegata]|uniref:Uncharacterized protein n=1 Tax=Bauhinia variegata TaxID=167791 RepID=A0ACB9PS88_BAUVA|nr:hypothetical protein L6164_005762 [Bauhinia variegata]
MPNPLFKLVLVHGKPLPSAVGLIGLGVAQVLPIVDADLKRIASKVTEKAKEFCTTKSVIITFSCSILLCHLSSHHYHLSCLILSYPNFIHRILVDFYDSPRN